MTRLVGTTQIYAGPLKPYLGRRCKVLVKWDSGLCKGRYQVRFEEPVLDTDGLELDPELTVSPMDLACL